MIFACRLFQEIKISDSILGLTFSVLACTVAVKDVAQNHSNSARNVCQRKVALGGSSATGGHTVVLPSEQAYHIEDCRILRVYILDL